MSLENQANISKTITEWRSDGVAWLTELVNDGMLSARSNINESGFLSDLDKKLKRLKGDTYISTKQWNWLLQIEKKIHAT